MKESGEVKQCPKCKRDGKYSSRIVKTRSGSKKIIDLYIHSESANISPFTSQDDRCLISRPVQ